MVFMFFSVTLGGHCAVVRGAHTLNKYCVTVYGRIFILFLPFFRRDCRFRSTREFPFSSPGGATIFVKLRSKIAKTPEIGEKVCAHNFI